MFIKAVILWVLGLLTLVPYGIYYLLFEAAKDQYALLIVGILFWVFGYWGVVGPLLTLAKVRTVLRALEASRSKAKLLNVLKNPDARDIAIDLIATENHIPRFVAARVCDLVVRRLSAHPEPRTEKPD